MGYVYKYYGRRHGPGGRYCACCNAYNCHPRKANKYERRLVRRKMKAELRNMNV